MRNKRTTQPQQTNKQGQIVAGLVMVLMLIAFLVGLAVSYQSPEQAALTLEKQRALMPFEIASKATGLIVFGIAAKVGIAVLTGYGLYFVIRIGVNFLDLRSRQIKPENGLYPVIQLSKTAYYDPNRDNPGANPIIALGAMAIQKQAAIRADKIIVRQTDKPALPVAESLPALTQDSVNLPELVKLTDIAHNITLDNLTLGISENGVITTSLHNMMHTLTIGASGFGKSAFLRALIWQLAQVKENVGIIAIDVNGSEFNTIREWSKLLYPVARDTQTAIATLQAVSKELEYRKGLYEQYPNAYDLVSFNTMSQNKLAPIVVLTDEGTNLLNQEGIGEPLRAVTQVARQYGVYLLLAGQSAKHNVIDTQIRDNFSTRLCFHTSPSSYRTVLGQSVSDVSIAGRAWAQVTGKTLQQIQCPYVSRDEVQAVLTTGKPQRVIDLEFVVPETSPQDDNVTKVLELKAQGASDTAIAREVFKYGNPHYIAKVREILQQQHKNSVV